MNTFLHQIFNRFIIQKKRQLQKSSSYQKLFVSRTKSTSSNTCSIIIISNSYDAPPSVIAGNLITTKADREHHGYGLKSVKNTLKKYGGDFEWNYDETSHTFTVTVMVGESTEAEKIKS